MVGEAPGTDRPAPALGEATSYFERPDARIPRREDIDLAVDGTVCRIFLHSCSCSRTNARLSRVSFADCSPLVRWLTRAGSSTR